MAAPRKNGSENAMRSANNVNASVPVCANAFFTMIALVENKTDPVKAMMNPAAGSSLCFFKM